MYAFIIGELLEKQDSRIVVKPDGIGFGLFVNVPLRTIAELPGKNATVTLYTSFQVREDSQTLFGFETPAERDLFEALLKITGIGGKIALAILDLPRDRIVAAIAAGDANVLKTVSGVGAKTAARIVLELKDRFAKELTSEWADIEFDGIEGKTPVSGIEARVFAEAIEALAELGYQRSDAREKIRIARHELGNDANTEQLIRHALTH
jgi:holliday junction DNA helicase RuvA